MTYPVVVYSVLGMKPQRLTLMKPECFYCKQPMSGSFLIEKYLGIQFCNVHQSRAERDGKAYLHESSLVPMSMVDDIPLLKEFIDHLESTPFLIRCPNGTVTSGWVVDRGYTGRETYIHFNKTWKLPLCKYINRDVMFPISLNNILVPTESIIALLSAGVFSSD